MRFPTFSDVQPTAAAAAVEAPMTLRNSRRLTEGTPDEGCGSRAVVSELIGWLVMAVRAVVARLLAIRRGDGSWSGLRARRRGGRTVARSLEPFLGAVAV